MVCGLRFRVDGFGYMAGDLQHVQGISYILENRFMVQGWGLGFRVYGLGFKV